MKNRSHAYRMSLTRIDRMFRDGTTREDNAMKTERFLMAAAAVGKPKLTGIAPTEGGDPEAAGRKRRLMFFIVEED